MSYTCGLVKQSFQPVLSIRTRTSVDKLPKVLGDAYKLIMEYLDEIDEYPAGAPFTAYYNMDMQDLDVEIGFPVWDALPGKNEIKSSEIQEGRHAVTIHVGPYNKIESAYNALKQWIKDKGYTPTGVAYEFYLNDPAQTPENKLKTRIQLPLA
ncbi:GyrI-like domain-containing protein [Desulfolucanica intricata]|uniref:GyrI-like domain-containing protein n=1 Tax=Desulfolucanica intricata TaxID=1285191 RepID=UPI000835F077|nr:GyrI-like domain-containing protein [Desulfolucanica intricata]